MADHLECDGPTHRRLVDQLEQLLQQLAGDTPNEDGQRTPTLGEKVAQLERALVLDALARSGGVQAAAARLLGVTERSVWHLVKKHRIEVARLKQTVEREAETRDEGAVDARRA